MGAEVGTRRFRIGVLAVGLVLLVGSCTSDSGSTAAGPAAGSADPATEVTADSTADSTAGETTDDREQRGELPMDDIVPTGIEAPVPIVPDPPPGMELIWSDEFDGPEIDRTNWTYDIGGWGWGNGEAQYYTDRPQNSRIENGVLVIELRQEPFDGSYYTSARMLSQGLQEFQYGRIEARIKVPKGSGTWPAFWMLGAQFDADADDPAKQWPNVGEIDIMEYVGREPDLVMGTIHGPGYAGAGGLTRWNRQTEDIGDDFRRFAIDWDETGIRWLYEGEPYYELTPADLGDREWVFDQEFFLILNLALGGTLGGNIALDLDYPIHYYVDYVRVYQRIESRS